MQMYVNLCDFVLLRTRILLLSAGDFVEVRGERRARTQRRQLPPAPLQERAILQFYEERGEIKGNEK